MESIDWAALFIPKLNLFELVIRGTLVYLMLFVLMRIFRRNAGNIGIADLLVIVIIADAAQNAMGNKYESVTEGAVLVGTILCWNFLLDWLPYRFPSLKHLLEPAPLLLIKDGRLLHRNLRKEMITKDELQAQIREQGVEMFEQVKICYLEGDGQISVIPKGKRNGHSKKRS